MCDAGYDNTKIAPNDTNSSIDKQAKRRTIMHTTVIHFESPILALFDNTAQS